MTRTPRDPRNWLFPPAGSAPISAPRTFEDALRFAVIAASDLAPKDYKGKPENVLIAVQMGAEFGDSPRCRLARISP